MNSIKIYPALIWAFLFLTTTGAHAAEAEKRYQFEAFRSIFINRNPGEPLMPKISIVQQPEIEFAGRDSMREQIEKLVEQQP